MPFTTGPASPRPPLHPNTPRSRSNSPPTLNLSSPVAKAKGSLSANVVSPSSPKSSSPLKASPPPPPMSTPISQEEALAAFLAPPKPNTRLTGDLARWPLPPPPPEPEVEGINTKNRMKSRAHLALTALEPCASVGGGGALPLMPVHVAWLERCTLHCTFASANKEAAAAYPRLPTSLLLPTDLLLPTYLLLPPC